MPLSRLFKGHASRQPAVSVADPRLDGWETVATFEDEKTAVAWRDQLRAVGLDSACTVDQPLDRFGRGEIYLVVAPGLWSRATEIIDGIEN